MLQPQAITSIFCVPSNLNFNADSEKNFAFRLIIYESKTPIHELHRQRLVRDLRFEFVYQLV